MLAAELALLFLLPPPILLVLRAHGIDVPVIPVLLGVFTVVCFVLARDRSFRGARLHGLPFGGEWKRIAVVFGIGALALSAFTALHDRDRLFQLPFERPWLWLTILVWYPLLSVVPQEVIYRSFFFHRYRRLLPMCWVRVVASALLFGYVHIVYANWLAVALSVVGGFMFAWTFARTRSLLLASVEHALYGCFIFTVGLRGYFFQA